MPIFVLPFDHVSFKFRYTKLLNVLNRLRNKCNEFEKVSEIELRNS